MASIGPYYDVGTVTLTVGSAAVTGQGTNWLTARLRPGDQIESNAGQRATILTINSNTSITLDRVYAGTAQAAGAYKVWRTPDANELLDKARSAFDLLGSGSVAAWAGLTLAADKLPYGTGAGTLGLTDFPAASRTQIAAGLGNAAARTSQTAMYDATAGRVLTVGAFGLGAAISSGAIPTQAQLDDPTLPTGIYRVVTPTGLPAGTYSLINSNPTGSSCSQRLERINVAYGIYSRISSGPLTTPWVAEHIERGSNANGDFTQFGDGTLVCTKQSFTLTYANTSVLNATWTFPAAFTADPRIFVSHTGVPPAGHREAIIYPSGISTVNAVLAKIDNAGSYTGGETTTVCAMAIGRWF